MGADATCAQGQACVDTCACGDKACLTSCAVQHTSTKALAVLTCATAHCQLETGAVSAMPDCSTTACPTTCKCIESNCESAITDCLADATCAQGQACVDTCACGDKACLTSCAL